MLILPVRVKALLNLHPVEVWTMLWIIVTNWNWTDENCECLKSANAVEVHGLDHVRALEAGQGADLAPVAEVPDHEAVLEVVATKEEDPNPGANPVLNPAIAIPDAILDPAADQLIVTAIPRRTAIANVLNRDPEVVQDPNPDLAPAPNLPMRIKMKLSSAATTKELFEELNHNDENQIPEQCITITTIAI